MPCRSVNFPDGGGMIICSRGGPKCHIAACRGGSDYQCDFPVGEYKSGKKKGLKRTCDRHICKAHVRHGKTPGVDFCSEHFPIAKAAYDRRMAKEVNS